MKEKMNLLLITTDQQRFDTIHAAGYDHMITPNLDRLAEEGTLFTNAYSSNPACIPARHNILTGLGARYHGFDDNYFNGERVIPYDLPTFPQLLSDHGYDTAGIGKMHFQPTRRYNGFQHLKLMEEIPRCIEDDEYAQHLNETGYGRYQSLHGVRHMMYMMPQQSFLPEGAHGSTWVTDQAIDYLNKNERKVPFALWVSYIAPHPPFDVSERFADIYKDKKLPELIESETPISPLAIENQAIAAYPNGSWLQRSRELYFAAITQVDENIGRILNALEENGQLDQTLIVFTSDHGEMMGDCGTYQKFLPYDRSAKIPMILRCPKFVTSGTIREDFVDLNDILPTFLDAAGISYPVKGRLKGKSLIDKQAPKTLFQFVEYGKENRRWISVRDKSYKYNYYYGGGYEELFHMKSDPGETKNLLYGSQNGRYESVRNLLRDRLLLLEQERGLPGYVENGDFKIFEEYLPKNYKERNFPKHLDCLSEEERSKLISRADEVLAATKQEDIVDFNQMDPNEIMSCLELTEKELERFLQDAKERQK